MCSWRGTSRSLRLQWVNGRMPELGTTASIGGEKEVNATEVFTLEDVVEYTIWCRARSNTIKGVLMDKPPMNP